jgi:hypothetical protein
MEAGAHKKENKPIKQGLKKTQKAGSSPWKDPDTRKGSCRPGKAGTWHHSFGQNLPTRTVTKTPGHSPIGNSNSVGQQDLSALRPAQPRTRAQAPATRPEKRSLPIPTPGNTLHWNPTKQNLSVPSGGGLHFYHQFRYQFRVPSSIGSDNGPVFVSQVIKEISHHLQRL